MKLKPIKATEGGTVKMSEVFDRMRYDALVDLFIDGRPSFDEAEAAAHAITNYDGLLGALLAAVECGMVPTSSAAEGGAMKYVKQAHVADQIRAAISKASGGKS